MLSQNYSSDDKWGAGRMHSAFRVSKSCEKRYQVYGKISLSKI